MIETAQPRSAQIMMIFGAVIIVGVLLYYGFWTLDGLGLEDEQGTATVTGKEYVEPGMTYSRQYIGGQLRTLPQTTGEMYILELNIGGEVTSVAVDKNRYDAVKANDEVDVVYQRRRLTGGLQVVELEARQ